MFSSLDRVDWMAEDAEGRICIQTDHRSPEEMDETPELSVLFALVRMLLPRRLAKPGEPALRLRYTVPVGLSRGVAEAVAAAGGESMIGGSQGSQPVPYDGPISSVAALADRAFAGLAHRVALREELPISAEGLRTFEERVLALGLDLEDSEREIEVWTAVLELAAFTGECLRALRGGQWVFVHEALASMNQDITPSDLGLLPFAFAPEGGSTMLTNAANKAMRAMSEPGQSVLQMLVSARPDEGEGRTMVNLKPAGWAIGKVVSRPLLEKVEGAPTVVICRDRAETVAYAVSDSETPESIEAMFAEALANLAEVEVEIDELDLDRDMELYVVRGDYYAAEKILDVAFMHGLHERLRQELLAVSVPVKGRMFVTGGAQEPGNLAALVALTRSVYETEANPISPEVFGVMGGRVSALVRMETASDEPPPKKSLWRRLFG